MRLSQFRTRDFPLPVDPLPVDLASRLRVEGIVPLEGVSLLIGANSSGKTALLEEFEFAAADSSSIDIPSRSMQRMHYLADTELLVHADLSVDSDDIKLLGRVQIEHYRFETVENVIRSMGDPAKAIAVGVYERFRDQRYGVSPPIELLKDWASTGLFELIVDEYNNLRIAIAQGLDSPTRLPFEKREVGLVPDAIRRECLPAVAVAPAELTDVSAFAQSLLESVVESLFPEVAAVAHVEPALEPPRRNWITSDEELGYVPAPGLREVARLLSSETERLLPPFVASQSKFFVRVLEPDRWWEDQRVIVGFESGGQQRRVESYGSGTRRWVSICLLIAATNLCQRRIDFSSEGPRSRLDALVAKAEDPRDLDHLKSIARIDYWYGGGALESLSPPTNSTMLILDEPELHLHPDAQDDVADWLASLVSTEEVTGALVATHSPQLLRVNADHCQVSVLRRGPETTTIQNIDGDDLAELDHAAASQGLGRASWFFSTRAVLLVEGQHDLELVSFFFGSELARARVRMLALRGTSKVSSLIDSEFLGASGLPLFVLFDNLRVQQVRDAKSTSGLSDEERVAWSLLQQARADDLTFLTYPEPDILCSVPLRVLARRFPQLGPKLSEASDERGYWSELIKTWRSEGTTGKGRSFKKWAAEYFDVTNKDLPTVALEVLARQDEPSPHLRQAINELLAHVADR